MYLSSIDCRVGELGQRHRGRKYVAILRVPFLRDSMGKPSRWRDKLGFCRSEDRFSVDRDRAIGGNRDGLVEAFHVRRFFGDGLRLSAAVFAARADLRAFSGRRALSLSGKPSWRPSFGTGWSAQ